MGKRTISEATDALTSALQHLAKEQAEYDAAKDAESAASKRTTVALNTLNARQRELDKLIADIREVSEGDWGANRRAGKGCYHGTDEV